MQGSGIAQFIPLILIFVIFYFFLIRPQQKKMKAHKAMVAALKRGDKVITSGGIIGTIERVMDDDIIPGINCIKNYTDQCVKKNGIIGGNGRLGLLTNISNTNSLYNTIIPDVGPREGLLVDFVGHMWVFKKDWLYLAVK